MLASLADAPLTDPQLVCEPKYDGVRAIAEIGRPVSAGGREPHRVVRLWSRLGNEKTQQFPEVTAALEKWARTAKVSAILDGEIVALDPSGEPTGFQQLQGRIHLSDGSARSRPTRLTGPAGPTGSSVAYILFDLLREGDRDLRDRPFVERRTALERLLGGRAAKETGPSSVVRISEIARGNGRALYERAQSRSEEHTSELQS